ncbi:MAG: AraC family transcriptional regulator [Planctomycetota bacterium]|nr:AraC family transcriptional regulator [Planctomycetota bacterium]
MTYFDPPESHAILYEAIHGGPPPRPREVKRMLASAGVGFPCAVVALQYAGRKPPRLAEGRRALPPHRLLAVHPNMAYLSFAGPDPPFARALARRRLEFGPPHPCPAPQRWVGAVQQAILKLRARQFAPLERRLGELSFERERAARQEALRLYRERHAPYEAAVRDWLRIVLVRHQRQLHEVRRKLLEFLMLLTRDLDEGWGLDRALHEQLARLRETFALPLFLEAFPEALRELARYLRGRLADAGEPGAAGEPVRRAQGWLRERLAEPVGLAQAAAAAHVSPAHLSRLFRKETGRTLTEFLQRQRVDRARKLLAETGHGLLQVALESGFQTPEHFHRVFKKFVRMTPRAYRLAQRA